MNATDWRRVKELFQVAADLAREERDAWLTRQVMDPTVRAQVELQLRMLDTESAEFGLDAFRPEDPSQPTESESD